MIGRVALLACGIALPLYGQRPVLPSEAGTSKWLGTEGRSILRATVATDDRKTGIRSREDHEVRRISLQSCVLSWSSVVRTSMKTRLMETHDSATYDSSLRLAELDSRRSGRARHRCKRCGCTCSARDEGQAPTHFKGSASRRFRRAIRAKQGRRPAPFCKPDADGERVRRSGACVLCREAAPQVSVRLQAN
jgi:hypothetical protein